MLNDERGPVIETLIARTLRLAESSQSMIRIVCLSATLPNHIDVAHFVGVSPERGLFYFDQSYRPVPLATQFVGIAEVGGFAARGALQNSIAYKKAVDAVRRGKQAMVFVHSRKDTGKVRGERGARISRDEGKGKGGKMWEIKIKEIMGKGIRDHRASHVPTTRALASVPPPRPLRTPTAPLPPAPPAPPSPPQTARTLAELARGAGEIGLFEPHDHPQYALIAKQVRGGGGEEGGPRLLTNSQNF